jgi:hypothetical protein
MEKDLSDTPRMKEMSLKWLIDASTKTLISQKFFLTWFHKTRRNRKTYQIEAGNSEAVIKATYRLILKSSTRLG